MNSWTITTNWFPHALSSLCLDLGKSIQLRHGERPCSSSGSNRLIVPMADGTRRVYEVCGDSTVVVWDEEGAGRLRFPTITYYRIGSFDPDLMRYLLKATMASSRIAILGVGRKVA